MARVILKEEDLPDAIAETPVVVSDEVAVEEVPQEVETNSYLGLVNDAIVKVWENIDLFRDIVATISLDKPEWQDVIDIVNGVIDDSLVITGMLSKASELIDRDSVELMSDGIAKASNIIGDTEEEVEIDADISEALKDTGKKYQLQFKATCPAIKGVFDETDFNNVVEKDYFYFDEVPSQEQVEDRLHKLVDIVGKEFNKTNTEEEDGTTIEYDFGNIKLYPTDFRDFDKDVVREYSDYKDNFVVDTVVVESVLDRVEKGADVYPIKEFLKKEDQDIIDWWKRVEQWNSRGNRYNINNDGATIDDMRAAMFDMLIDLNGEDDVEARELVKQGRRLYNKQAYVPFRVEEGTASSDKEKICEEVEEEKLDERVVRAIENIKKKTGLTNGEIYVWLMSNDMGFGDVLADYEDARVEYAKASKVLDNSKLGLRLLDIVDSLGGLATIGDELENYLVTISESCIKESATSDLTPKVLDTVQKKYIINHLFVPIKQGEKYYAKLNEPWTIRHYHEFDCTRYEASDDFPYILEINNQKEDLLSKDFVDRLLQV